MNDLRNIPPLWTAFAQWAAAAAYITLLPRRFKGWHLALLLLPFLAVQGLWLVLIGDWDGMPFNLAMFASAILTLLPFLLIAKHLPVNALIYHCARAFIVSGFCVSFAWQLCIYVEPLIPMSHLTVECTAMLVLIGIPLGIIYLLERRYREANRELSISMGTLYTVVLMAFFIYILSSLSYAPIKTPFSGTTEADAFNLRTWIYLGGVALLYAYHVQLCEAQSRQELIKMQGILEMQRANYTYSKEAVDLVNRKYHDLKHQIAVLRSGISSDDKLHALDQMEAEIKAYETENKTGNQVLDIVLTGKAITCRNNSIELTIVADGTALSFMDWMDIPNMFGNMLDNAIEAVLPLPVDQRLIHLSVAKQRGFLCILMENPYDETIKVETIGGLPISLHKSRAFHGFGVKSIAATAKKYNGTASFKREDGWFRLRVLIPLSES